MIQIREGGITFEFGSAWTDAFKWDDCPEAKRLIDGVAGSKAVDFVGVNVSAELLFMEVKDYRVADPTDVPTAAELATTVAQKVRDSLAGVAAACNKAARAGGQDQRWKQVFDALAAAPGITILLWCEGRIGPNVHAATAGKRAKASALPLMRLLARKLKWLTANIVVASSANAGDGTRIGVSAAVV